MNILTKGSGVRAWCPTPSGEQRDPQMVVALQRK
jgi:hypothetical protein